MLDPLSPGCSLVGNLLDVLETNPCLWENLFVLLCRRVGHRLKSLNGEWGMGNDAVDVLHPVPVHSL